MRKFTFIKLILIPFAILLLSNSAVMAQQKKPKKKVSILRKGYDDITTRNNYYYNANYIYKELIKSYTKNYRIESLDSLPFYFHDNADFSANKSQLDDINKKIGIVLQHHDYSRWKDDCYLLLGKTYYLNNNFDSALFTFKYLVSNLKGKTTSTKSDISSKDILKLKKQRQKELDKAVKNKKKVIQINQEQKEKQMQDIAAEKKEKMEDAAKLKEKELKAKIKAKEKMIKQKKKGKYDASKAKKPTTPTTVKKPETVVAPKAPIAVKSDKKSEEAIKKLEEAKLKEENADIDAINKKEAQKNKLSFWQKIKHKAARPEAIVWAVKSNIQRKDFDAALTYLEYGKGLRKLTKKQQGQIALVDAYYHIKKGNINTATQKLEAAIPVLKSKKDKAYYTLYLAHLHQLSANDSSLIAAIDAYKKVLKITKDEDMVYNANLQLAQLYTQAGSTNSDIEKTLKKLTNKSKDESNVAQARLALGNIYLSKSDTTKAIKEIALAAANKKDANTAADAFLALGDIYYDSKLYISAAAAYDSAKSKTTNEHHKIIEINQKANAFDHIREGLTTITDQDSVITLGKMTKPDLELYLEKLRKQEQKEEKKKNAKSDNLPITTLSQESFIANGLWYFYNPDTKAKGYNKFVDTWGQRNLKHYWNIQNKSSNIFDNISEDINNTESEDLQKADTSLNNSKNLKKVVKIPTTPSEFFTADSLIKSAYYNIAYAFYAELNDYSTSYSFLKTYYQRFPQVQDPQVAYLMYLNAKALGLENETVKYKTQVEQNPQHTANKTLKATEKSSQQSAEEFYKATYLKYQDGKYEEVIEARNKFKQIYDLTPWTAQMEYLYAMSMAKTDKIDLYKNALVSIVDNFPGTEVSDRASKQLVDLENLNTPISNASDTKESEVEKVVTEAMAENVEKQLYKDNGGQFFVMFVIKNKTASPDNISLKVNDFLADKYLNNAIKASPSFLDENIQLVLVKRFVDISNAKNFYNDFSPIKNQILGSDVAPNVDIYLISQDNFKSLFISKDLESYLKFYKEKLKL
jgi:tetratricopeptide (TPR) repeat protein